MIKQHRYDSFIGYPHRWAKQRKEYRRKYWKKTCAYTTRWRLCNKVIKDMERKNRRMALITHNRAMVRKTYGKEV